MGTRDGVRRFRSGERVSDADNTVPSIPPIPLRPVDYNLPPRTSTVRMSTSIQAPPNPRREGSQPTPRRPSSPALSSVSRMSRYMPRVGLFKEVMRDEVSDFVRSYVIQSDMLSYATRPLSPLSQSFLS
jgi:hypothetical protein